MKWCCFHLSNNIKASCNSLCRWKLLDFAELKRSSISFFDIGKPETAVSRWSRARTRAAKVSFKQFGAWLKNIVQLYMVLNCWVFFWQVGKGLSKVGNAKKLALQHWLEAVSLMLKVNLWTKLLVLFVACFQSCYSPKQIDPRHRYGHNLQFYYVKWLHCESRQPFFYW